MDNKKVSILELLPIHCILEATEQNILESYPPLRSQVLISKLKDASFQNQVEKIEVYFNKLREDFSREVSSAEKRAKEALI